MNKKIKYMWLWITFAIIILSALTLINYIIVSVVLLFLENNNARPHMPLPNPLIFTIISSAVIGTAIVFILAKIIMRPINKLSNGLNKIASGDFSARIEENTMFIEVEEMNQNFNKMAKELSSIETLRNDFVVSVSHEFKTPITAIEGYASLLQNPKLTENNKNEFIEKILKNTKRLSTLTGNILMLSKLENQEIELEKNEFSLDEQIRNSILSLENEWSNKNIEFNLELPNTIIYGNEELLFQVWYNLINNAIKFSDDYSEIKIEIKNTKSGITVIIKDYGCGISNDDLNHIFDKFYQADISRNQNGNGLGLALVHKIISLCNASIEVNSTINIGTTFTINFKRI